MTRAEKLTIESDRTLGGIGAVFTLLGVFSVIASLFHDVFPNSTGISATSNFIGDVFAVSTVIGFLLFLIAMYGFSKDYNEPRIFSNLVYGIVITIIAVVVAIVIAVIIILFNFATFFPNLSSSTSFSSSKTFGFISPFFSLAAVVWIVFVVRAFNLLSDKSKVPLFRTGAKLVLAGALVNIVIAVTFGVVGFYVALSLNTLLALLTVGNLIQNVAWVLLAKAYFRVQTTAVPMQAASPINASPVSGQIKYCRYCGAPNQTDASYCTHCGQKI